MDAVLFLKERARMTNFCEIACFDCPMGGRNNGFTDSCSEFHKKFPEEAVAVVQKWSKEHPVKTVLDDFFEKHPKAPKNEVGRPYCCPWSVGYQDGCEINYGRTDCKKCWSRPLEVSK